MPCHPVHPLVLQRRLYSLTQTPPPSPTNTHSFPLKNLTVCKLGQSASILASSALSSLSSLSACIFFSRSGSFCCCCRRNCEGEIDLLRGVKRGLSEGEGDGSSTSSSYTSSSCAPSICPTSNLNPSPMANSLGV